MDFIINLRKAGVEVTRTRRYYIKTKETSAPKNKTAFKKKKAVPLQRKSAQKKKAVNENKKKPLAVITLDSSESSGESGSEEDSGSESESDIEMEDQDSITVELESLRLEHQGTSEPPISASTIKFNFNPTPSLLLDSFEKRRREESARKEENQRHDVGNRIEKRREVTRHPMVQTAPTMIAREKRRLQNLEKHLRRYGEDGSSNYHSSCHKLEEEVRNFEETVRRQENQTHHGESPEPEVIFDSRSALRQEESRRKRTVRREEYDEIAEKEAFIKHVRRREEAEKLARWEDFLSQSRAAHSSDSVSYIRQEEHRHDKEIEKREESNHEKK